MTFLGVCTTSLVTSSTHRGSFSALAFLNLLVCFWAGLEDPYIESARTIRALILYSLPIPWLLNLLKWQQIIVSNTVAFEIREFEKLSTLDFQVIRTQLRFAQ